MEAFHGERMEVVDIIETAHCGDRSGDNLVGAAISGLRIRGCRQGNRKH
jgi:hypothetical protein